MQELKDFRWEQKSLEGCKEPSYTWQGWLPFYSMREKVLLLAIILAFVSYNRSCHRSCKHNWYCNGITHINNHISYIIVELYVLCGFSNSRSSSFIHTSIPYGTVSSFPSPYIHPSVGALAPSKAPPSSIVTGAWRKQFFLWSPKALVWNSWRVGKPKKIRAPNFVKTHAAVIHNSTTNSPYPWHWRHLHALFQTLKISLAEMEKVTTTPQGLAWIISDGTLLEMLDAMSPRFRNKFNDRYTQSGYFEVSL